MTIALNNDVVRKLVANHIQEKFNVTVDSVYLHIDDESGTFQYAEADIVTKKED